MKLETFNQHPRQKRKSLEIVELKRNEKDDHTSEIDEHRDNNTMSWIKVIPTTAQPFPSRLVRLVGFLGGVGFSGASD